MRILLLNNYEMDGVLVEWKAGTCPAHHLWGALELERSGVAVDILPYEKFRALNRYWRLQRLLHLTSRGMTALDQQLRALGHFRAKIIYAACQDHTFLLARLRRMGLLRKQLVVVVHHPIEPGSKEERLLAAHDLVLCLSQAVHDQILARRLAPPERVRVIDWGPDLDFYGPFRDYARATADSGLPAIISAGKTSRDYDSLIQGARGLECTLEVYCSADSAPTTSCDSNQVQLHVGSPGTNAISHVDMRAAYRRAYAIAIPMPAVNRLAGLTSLLDAMAIGRPVVMTRNAYIDIDIEREGFGIWVEPGDIAGWRGALQNLLSNPILASDMGKRARAVAEEKHNLRLFARRLECELKKLLPTVTTSHPRNS